MVLNIMRIETTPKIIAKTEPIPNDTVSVRPGLPPEVVRKLKKGLLDVAASEEGRKTVLSLYGIDSFADAKDSDYDSVRYAVRELKLDLAKAAKGG